MVTHKTTPRVHGWTSRGIEIELVNGERLHLSTQLFCNMSTLSLENNALL